jgi:predicted short-subunit dehydrogenase-like oxidoreductase (DUF2520 family)
MATIEILIVGRGKVGTALARAGRRAGCHVATASHGRLPRKIDADLVFLAVPDAAVASVARSVAARATRTTTLAHVAGRIGADVLAAARANGHAIATCHPMVSFADTRRPPSLAGASFVAAGDRRAIATLRRFAKILGMHLVHADVHGPAYHAAAALVANGTAALADAGVDILAALGITRRDAANVLAGLLRSVAENVEHVGVPEALTGPIARGDAATVRLHRAALAELGEDELATYDAIAPVIVRTASSAGLSKAGARAIRRELGRPPR